MLQQDMRFTPDLVTPPEIIQKPADFEYLIPQPNRTDVFMDAISHMRTLISHGRFVVALVWPDGNWCVLYDNGRQKVDVFPGQIKEAYFAAQRGEHIFPSEGRSRLSWSSGRSGL